jgi:hypothetical protein
MSERTTVRAGAHEDEKLVALGQVWLQNVS